MTTKTITGNYSGGFTLSASFNGLTIANGASVEGTGVFVTALASVTNYGAVNAGTLSNDIGIYLNNGGTVGNYGGDITGYIGVKSTPTLGKYPAGFVNNFSSIGGVKDGVLLLGGGIVRNGLGGPFSQPASAYVITGGANGVDITGGGGTVFNNGIIKTVYRSGVEAAAGVQIATGYVYNTGTIYGDYGVRASGATSVINSGTISGGTDGVWLQGGGSITNGAIGETGALITSYGDAVRSSGASVTNFGTIKTPTFGDVGVYLSSGASLTNGALTDRGALVEGYVGGVFAASNTSNITNFGVIFATSAGATADAVTLTGGTLTNGTRVDTSALIEAYTAVTVTAGGVVNNLGAIFGTGLAQGSYGINFTAGGSLTNGSLGDHAALVEGYIAVEVAGAAGTVTNFGTLKSVAAAYFGVVEMLGGGQVTNGSAFEPAALISGYNGVEFGAVGTLSNFGTVASLDDGVFLEGGGAVTNGSATDHAALISGYQAVFGDEAFTVGNFGTIVSSASADGGVTSEFGASVTNGSGGDLTAQISGADGVLIDSYSEAGVLGTVVNYATITGESDAGVALSGGGQVTNGRGAVRSSLIQGANGVFAAGGAATVTNSGTILGNGSVVTDSGVYLGAGGSLTNGSATNGTALIEGYNGVRHLGSGTVVNFGTISALGDTSGDGVALSEGGFVINGSSGHAGALIEGYGGVATLGAATVTNFGTIDGEGGIAVALASSSDLVVEAGSAFIGSILGGGGTLELGSGVGTLTGLLAVGNVTVSGSMAATTFTNFGTVQIDAPASFTLAGTGGTIAAGQALVVAGTLAGTGTLSLTGGTSTFNTGADLTIAKVTETGAATVANFNGPTITVADVWTQTSGQITVATGDKVNFTGVGDTFSGTLGGAGTVGFTGGTDALTGTKITAATTLAAGATVTLSGAIDLTSTATVTSANVVIAAAGATLSGAGTVSLTNAATNAITGATAGATLTNGDTIKGAGLLGNGQMVLINQASGVINATLTTALTINTGTSTVTNAGMIENAGTGGLIITGAVANTGTLNVTAGTLAVNGAVTGAGTVRISGGTADFASTFTENVTFTTTGGTLELAKSQTYTGQITGFAKTPVSSLDLLDIAFGTKTTATFSGTTTSGVLTVTDGTHTAKITLVGNYTTSTFTTASDGHGGTTVTDPPKPPAALPPMLPLVTAMAGFGGGPSHALVTAGPDVREAILVRPAA